MLTVFEKSKRCQCKVGRKTGIVIIPKSGELTIRKSFEIIGEAAKHIPAEIKQEYPLIKCMAGMRDKLAHEYFGVDVEIYGIHR